MRIIDLSSTIDSEQYEPDPVEHFVLTPAEGARHMSEEMHKHFGLAFEANDLPDGEFLSLDRLSLTTHTGTHVDAPSHYGTRASYKEGSPRNIDEMPLDWFYRPGMVLNLTDQLPGAVGKDILERGFAQIGRLPEPMEIVLLNTGAQRNKGTRDYFTDFVGLDGPATEYLLDLGVKVIGTDAFSLDAPFTEIIERYGVSGDRSVLWPAHFVGRDREYCQVERLTNLDLLPSQGFTVVCFPVKVARAGAGWTRAVALVDEP